MRVIHVFRAPIGGLFRHVIDLVKEQSRRGHEVGIFCDATFAGDRNENLLKELSSHLALGLERVTIRRNPHPTDLIALTKLGAFSRRVSAEVLHGHGSKGGLFARLGGPLPLSGEIKTYTPHGGSLNYRPGSALHRAYMKVERLLEFRTDAFLFESQFIADRYKEYVHKPSCLSEIVLNGLYDEEFEPIEPDADAADLLYIGEYRFAKGIDTLLKAMRIMRDRRKRSTSLIMVGQGPDEAALKEQAEHLGLTSDITFLKPMAASQAFRKAQTMVVPSRFESMPYVVIEAAGAAVPMISTDVGGIPEIFGPFADLLIPCDDADRMATELQKSVESSRAARLASALALQAYVREHFSVRIMSDRVLAAYESCAKLRGRQISPARDMARSSSP
jgi:glycosyltransferase involved in cell wall biosynthesis